jgi:hypothetical protein
MFGHFLMGLSHRWDLFPSPKPHLKCTSASDPAAIESKSTPGAIYRCWGQHFTRNMGKCWKPSVYSCINDDEDIPKCPFHHHKTPSFHHFTIIKHHIPKWYK